MNSINISGLTEMQKRLKDIKNNLNNIGEFKDIPFRLLDEKIKQKFEQLPLTQTGGQLSSYKSTPPLSASYLRSHPHRQNKQLLTNTGELKYSFTYEHPNNIADYINNTFIYGSKLNKAKMKRVKDIIAIDPELNREMQKYLSKGIMTNKISYLDITGILI